MLEEICRSAVYKACREQENKTPLVCLKGKPWIKANRFDGFFDRWSSYTFWAELPLQRATRQRPGGLLRQSWAWMNDNAERVFNGYIKTCYEGNLEKAMVETETFDNLFACFKSYFKAKRMEFMNKTEKALSERKAELAAKGKTPQSHGGVANLLKVLTKTMYEQGSTILTIARVQYAVCLQAGIYIPEEFLTDVLTAEEIAEVAE